MTPGLWIAATVPASVTMAPQIAARRERLKDARKASRAPAAPPFKAKPGRKLVAGCGSN